MDFGRRTITLYELLQLTEEELLTLYRGLRQRPIADCLGLRAAQSRG